MVEVGADAEVDGVDRLEREKSSKRRPVYLFDGEAFDDVQVHLEIYALERR